MKNRIFFQCPCGYCFEILCSEKEAITKVKLHFEYFHGDLLPFGITEGEALKLLKVIYKDEKTQISTGKYSLTHEVTSGPRSKSGSIDKPKKKGSPLINYQFAT